MAPCLLESTPVQRFRACAAVAALLLAACGDDRGAAPDAGALDAGPVAQGSEATGDLAINEVAPGGDPDWFELVNRSDAAIDLCDYFATDSLDRLDHYVALGGAAPPDPCEPRMLDAGAYLVVFADDAAEPGPDHAPFKLAQADEVHLAEWATGAAVDGLLYLDIGAPGESLARIPDRDGLFLPATPTPGEANP